MAWTVTPTADEAGNVSGFSTDHAHEGYWKDGARDYVEDPITNQVSHVMQDVELNEDYQEPEYTTEGYFETLASLHPNVAQAAQWAADGGMSVEWSQDFNAAIERGDLEAVNAGLEQLLGMYDAAHGDRPSASEEYNHNREEDSSDEEDLMTYEDLSDSDREVVNNVVEELQYNTPQGEEYAQMWDEAVTAGQQAGDGTYALVAAATAAFHGGEMSASEAIQYCLENADIRELSRVWNLLNQ